LQRILADDHLVLSEAFKPASDSDVVPKGHRLIRRGHMLEYFGADVPCKEMHRGLAELASAVEGEGDLRLLFSGDDYNSSRESASRAIEELGAIIRVVKSSARAFPDTVLPQSRSLLEKQHHGEIRAVTLENRRRIQVQEREAQEMVRTANMRLSVAEAQKVTAQGKLREAFEEKVLAETAKVDAQNRSQQVLQLYETLQRTSEKLEKEKSDLQTDQSEWMKTRELMEAEQQRLKAEKGELQYEKNDWTAAREVMEQEQKVLQADIVKARAERKRLEEAAEKWQQTLASVKKEAEGKEAHLKEIQAILKNAPTIRSSNCASPALPEFPPQTSIKQNPKVLTRARTMNHSNESNDVLEDVEPEQVQEQETPVLLQLWAVMSKAFGGDSDSVSIQRSRASQEGGTPKSKTMRGGA